MENASLARETSKRLQRIGLVGNGSGALIVFLFALFVAPKTFDFDDARWLLVVLPVGFVVYMGISLPLGRAWAGKPFLEGVVPWLENGGPADDRVRQLVLGHPLAFARVAVFF